MDMFCDGEYRKLFTSPRQFGPYYLILLLNRGIPRGIPMLVRAVSGDAASLPIVWAGP